MKQKVKSIMLPITPAGIYYEVGRNCRDTDKKICIINHILVESENGNIYSSFEGYDNENNIIFSIENCPVVVMYQ